MLFHWPNLNVIQTWSFFLTLWYFPNSASFIWTLLHWFFHRHLQVITLSRLFFLCLQAILIGCSISTKLEMSLSKIPLLQQNPSHIEVTALCTSCFCIYKKNFEGSGFLKMNWLKNYDSQYLCYERPNVRHTMYD